MTAEHEVLAEVDHGVGVLGVVGLEVLQHLELYLGLGWGSGKHLKAAAVLLMADCAVDSAWRQALKVRQARRKTPSQGGGC